MVNDKNKDIHELHVTLDNDIYDKLEAVKEYHGIKSLTEIVRFLITKEFRNIEKED